MRLTSIILGLMIASCASLERGDTVAADAPEQITPIDGLVSEPVKDAPTPSTPDGPKCDPDPEPECVEDEDCDVNEVCRNDRCYAGCDRDEQCPHGDMSCRSGICRYDTNHD